MDFKLKKSALSAAVMLACSLGAQVANAGATINFGEDKYITAGFGFITSYSSVEDAANGSKDRSNDFSLDSARIYLSGSANKYIKGMLNTEKSGSGGSIEVIDANVQFQLTPEVAIWAGRFLSPSDRANMAGPYYSMGGGYWANIASRYGWNGGIIGRDEGVALVSSLMEDHLAVSFGAFNGDNIYRFSGAGGSRLGAQENSSVKDKLMYAGRVQYNFWDAEPGYYGTGNYFGAKDILSIGVAGRIKKDGVIANDTANTYVTGDYKSYSVDALMEKKDVGPGTLSAEAAYYYYDNDNVLLSEQGTAYSAGLGYLFNEQVGWGKFMPIVRYQKFDADGATAMNSTTGVITNTRGSADTKRFEMGVNYVMQPYNAVLTATYGKTDTSTSSSVNDIKVALQMQF